VRKASKWVLAIGLAMFAFGLILWLMSPQTVDTLFPGFVFVPLAAAGLIASSVALLSSWRSIAWPWRTLAIVLLLVALLPLLLLGWALL
jgi:hypothetical protein